MAKTEEITSIEEIRERLTPLFNPPFPISLTLGSRLIKGKEEIGIERLKQ